MVAHTLYLIEILHQTTTKFSETIKTNSCILSKFYIKPQLSSSSDICFAVVSYRNSTSNHNTWQLILQILSLYLIEILHQTTTLNYEGSDYFSCILSKFYIKPQLRAHNQKNRESCILSKFYIKPQHFYASCCAFVVVSYRNSTSNHNLFHLLLLRWLVVSYRNSTSNHNQHKDTIKKNKVVSYRNSTSNHNTTILRSVSIIVVSYRNSTSNHNSSRSQSSAIKVVSYRNSTSNHNREPERSPSAWLYLIEILHQTTTYNYSYPGIPQLYLIEILHQTTTTGQPF